VAATKPSHDDPSDRADLLEMQQGPWEYCDQLYPPKNGGLTAEDVTQGLYNYITRPLSAAENALRNQRITESQSYFTTKPAKDETFNSVEEAVGSILDSYHKMGQQPLSTINQISLLRLVVTGELLPYPTIRQELHHDLQVINNIFPIIEPLGLRPLAKLHFMHEDVGILVFIASEDDVLYLWCREWNVLHFGAMVLVRATGTIDSCEEGILRGLHLLDFEKGGWLKIAGLIVSGIAVDGMAQDDIYGNVEENTGIQSGAFQM
jgi:hypothetical protein